MQNYKRCLIGIDCLIKYNKNCRNHTLQEKEHVSRLQHLQRFNIILGVIKEEVDGLYGFPIGLNSKIIFNKLGVIGKPLDGYQNYYYVLEFVSFEYGAKYPQYSISYEFGRIGDYIIEAEVKLFYESDLFQIQDKIIAKDCQNGIYKVLFGNQHVIKGTDQKKIQFERACDQNRAFDGCVVNYKLSRQVRGQLFGQVVYIIKNPLINQNIFGILSYKDSFEIEKRIKNPSENIQQFDRLQKLKEILNQNTLYLKCINSKLPTFQIINISEELLDKPFDIINNFFIAKYITWNKKCRYPWAEIIGTSGSISSFKDYERIILEENNIKTDRFTQQINQESNQIIEYIQKDIQNIDINQEQIIFSIDDSNTQIIDDSLSIIDLADETFQINIYIAHPSFYINESSKLYRECKSRISNCYFKNFFRPMMPKDLQKQLSLTKNTIRKCFCIKIIIKQGYPIYDSIEIEEKFIINKYQLTYKQIQKIIEQGTQSSDKLEQTIMLAFNLANQLKNLRKTLGCSIILNDDKNDDDLQNQQAKTLVTEFMILTNEAITYYVNQSTELFRKNLDMKMKDYQQIIQIEKQKKSLILQKYQLQRLQERKKRQALSNQNKEEQQKKIKYQQKQINEANNNDQQFILDLQNINININHLDNNNNTNINEKDEDYDKDNDLQIKEQEDTQQLNIQSRSSEESDSDSSSLNQLIQLNRSLKLDQDENIEDDFLDFNEMEYQDAKRNVQYLQERILQKLGLELDLTNLITFRKTRLQIEENINIDKSIRQYIKFQFRVKEKFLRICVLKNISLQKKEKKIQSQQQSSNNKQLKQQKLESNQYQAVQKILNNPEDNYDTQNIRQNIQYQQKIQNDIEPPKQKNPQQIAQIKIENNSKNGIQIKQQIQLEQNLIYNNQPPSQIQTQNIFENIELKTDYLNTNQQILQQIQFQKEIKHNIEPPKKQNQEIVFLDETQKQIKQIQFQQNIIKNIEPPKQSITENIEEQIVEKLKNQFMILQIEPPKQSIKDLTIENKFENVEDQQKKTDIKQQIQQQYIKNNIEQLEYDINDQIELPHDKYQNKQLNQLPQFELNNNKDQNQKLKFNKLQENLGEKQQSQYSGFPLLFQFYKSSQVQINVIPNDNNQFTNSPLIFVFLKDKIYDQWDELNELNDLNEQIQKKQFTIQDLDQQLHEINLRQKEQKSKQIEYTVDQNNAKEVIEMYYTIQDKEKMKFTSPLRRFNDLMVHFLVKNILKLHASIQNLSIMSEFDFNEQSKPQKKARGKQKSRKKQLSRAEIFNKLYKNTINEIMKLIKQKKEIVRFAQGCDETPSQTNHTAERQLEILILCKQIISKNCCINCDALITNIDPKYNKVQAYINTEGLEFEDVIEFDDKYFDSINYQRSNIQYRDKTTKQYFILSQYDKCQVSLDCDGLFPLKLNIQMKKKINDQ